jgi:pimeloyl-ACP methyl ester carboxylesterase
MVIINNICFLLIFRKPIVTPESPIWVSSNQKGRIKMKTQTRNIVTGLVFSLLMSIGIAANAADQDNDIKYKTVEIDGLNIFYREAGNPNKPTLLLLHGFPTSSHMFRDLIPQLSDQYHLVAPDYPGYGQSSMPSVHEFEYSFDNVAKIVDKFIDKIELKTYSLYLMDYGAPIGFRIATKHPERVEGLIIQNGNAYVEGIDNNFWEPIQAYWKDRKAINKGLDNDFWINVKNAYKNPNMSNDDALRFLVTLGATKWQYTNGVRNTESISPDTWDHVQPLLDRDGNQEIQLEMFYSYGTNPPLYPEWQAYLRKHQPPTLIVWGKNDEIFPAAGAHPYKRDLKVVDFNLLDTGHFALEEDSEVIAEHIRRFFGQNKVASH